MHLSDAKVNMPADLTSCEPNSKGGRECIQVMVTEVRQLTPRIRSFRLRRVDLDVLPSFTPGSHIEVEVLQPDGARGRRSYSLVGDPEDRTAYEIAVLHEASGRGGSRFMHEQVQPGTPLRIFAPANHFELDPSASRHLLIAGGIGITPLLCMARWLQAHGKSFELHYCARSEEAMAYRADVASLPADKVRCHFDGGDPSRGVDLEQLLGQHAPGDAVYVCGPQPLIAAVIDTCSRHSWPKADVHFEYFAAPPSGEEDTDFELVLQRSGRTIRVPAGKSILDALFEAGESPLHGCKTGDCGLCETAVLEGTPLHRDRVLSEGEKQSGRVMCICVSRAASPQLVLDL